MSNDLEASKQDSPHQISLIPRFLHRRIAHRTNLIRIVDNISWLFFDKILRMGVGLFVAVWIARYLGPEQFGLLNFATAFTGLFGAIASLGLKDIVVRDVVRNPDGARLTLGTAALLQLIGGLVAFLLALGTIAYLRPDDTLPRSIVAILGSMMLLKASDIAVFWFESQVQSKYTVWVQNGAFLVFAGIKVVLILKQASLITFVWTMLAETVVVALILLVVLSLRGPALSSLRASTARARSLLHDSWPLILTAIAISIYMKIDQIMLGQMIGDEAVGIYSAAVRISEVWYFAIAIVLASVFPTIAKLHFNNSELISLRWVQAYRLMFWLSLTVALLLTLSSSILVSILFGDEYSPAATVLTIHVWAGVNVAVGAVWGRWLLLEDKTPIGLYGHLIGAVMNVSFNLWLIPKFGAVGAALATLASYWFSAIIVYSIHKPSVTFGYIFAAITFRGQKWS